VIFLNVCVYFLEEKKNVLPVTQVINALCNSNYAHLSVGGFRAEGQGCGAGGASIV